MNHSAPHAHIGVDLYNANEPEGWKDEAYQSRALCMSFSQAVGEARLRFGSDIKGRLPEPVTTQFISTNGKAFYFCAFQLNTLDLDDVDGVKNIVWMSQERQDLYEVCDYVLAMPTLEGYNPNIFKTIAAMYLQGYK